MASLRGIPEEFCSHSGSVVITGGETPRCGDCYTEMVWVPKQEWLRKSTPGENERELQRLLNTRTSALIRISQYLREVGIG